jgi:hypothetical protein
MGMGCMNKNVFKSYSHFPGMSKNNLNKEEASMTAGISLTDERTAFWVYMKGSSRTVPLSKKCLHMDIFSE